MGLRSTVKERIDQTCIIIVNIFFDMLITGVFLLCARAVEWFIQFLGYDNPIILWLITWFVQPVLFLSLVGISFYHLYIGCFPPKNLPYELVIKEDEQLKKEDQPKEGDHPEERPTLVAPVARIPEKSDSKQENP